MKLLLLLCLLLSSCSVPAFLKPVVDPAVEIVEEGAEPITIGALVYFMAHWFSSGVAGVTALAVTAFWSTADAKDEARADRALAAATVLAAVGGENEPLEVIVERGTPAKPWTFLGLQLHVWVLLGFIGYLLKQPIWWAIGHFRRKKIANPDHWKKY